MNCKPLLSAWGCAMFKSDNPALEASGATAPHGIGNTSKATNSDSNKELTKQAPEQFLTFLAEGVDGFTFQTFDDNKQRKNPSLTRLLHGTLVENFEELCRLNALGAGIFVTVNETDLKGRTKANIVNVRAVFQEADRLGIPVPSLEPHIVVQTSPGKFHRYWLTHQNEAARREYEGVMRTMVDQYGSDPNARDLARVLRLPGFFHLKDVANPFLVSIVEASNVQPTLGNK